MIQKELLINERWSEIRGQVKRAYSNLNDEDLNYQAGQEEQLLAILHKRTGQSREDLIQWINQLVRTVFDSPMERKAR